MSKFLTQSIVCTHFQPTILVHLFGVAVSFDSFALTYAQTASTS
jgi:hypothetical protein